MAISIYFRYLKQKAQPYLVKLMTEVTETRADDPVWPNFLLLGAGPCVVCKECASNKNKPCRHPDKAFPSVEACGVDVMSLSKSVGLAYNNGKNTVTYIGAILY